jgi:hypothetical protein
MDTEAADLLANAGRAILWDDPGWMARFAEKLEINPQTFRAWLSGKSDPDPAVLEQARLILLERRSAVDEAAQRIWEFLNPAHRPDRSCQ